MICFFRKRDKLAYTGKNGKKNAFKIAFVKYRSGRASDSSELIAGTVTPPLTQHLNSFSDTCLFYEYEQFLLYHL